METEKFIRLVLSQAKAAGIDPAEVYFTSGSSFEVTAMNGAIDAYEVSDHQGLGLRGQYGGRMGYASTQAFDEEAAQFLVRMVQESAELCEEDGDEIFPGEQEYPALAGYAGELDGVTAQEKIDGCLKLERSALAASDKITQTEGATVWTGTGERRLVNSYGMDLHYRSGALHASVVAIAKDEGSTAVGFSTQAGRDWQGLDAEKLGREAAQKAIAALHGAAVAAGEYRVLLHRDAMRPLLSTFAGVFSGENAQQGLSLYKGREGEMVAAPCVTLLDDPLLPEGFASCPFDAEGAASRTKAIIDAGELKTLLHSRRTARRQGVQTTGNASRAGCAAPVRVAPTNLFITPGEKSPEALEAEMGEGLVITELGGLHAGANPVSGDFSLISKGYLVSGGKRVRPVEQITVAGNFYRVLQGIRAVGSDLSFEGGSVGAPSVDAGLMMISGK